MNPTINKLIQTRLIYLYIFLFCVSLLAIALYMEKVMMLEPCPLCMTQRVFFILAGLTSLIAFIHNPVGKGKMIYGLTAAVFALSGGGFAIRQIWLQHLPKDQVPACGPSVAYMFQEFPFTEALATMFTGDGNCAEITWQDPIIGMSIPQWSLVGFVALAGVCTLQALRK
ncbi:MAG: disulfide bond formation protein B [Gammaproteobacteria bacterium]|nr:disulfide bond formation protein B [Gammaproteobacteria bacterium]